MSDQYKIDGHKLIYHPERVAQWKLAGNDWEEAKKVYPIYMELSPFGGCNHRCSFCALDFVGYKPNKLDVERLSIIVPEMSSLGLKSIMLGGEGEPLLHPQIADICQIISNAGIDLALTTNGVHLKETFIQSSLAQFQWVKVSINAGTSETYSALHGCSKSDFYKVIENLKKAVAYREKNHLKTTLGAQILLLPENEKEIEKLIKICRDDVGIDYLVIKPFSQNPLSLSHKYQKVEYGKFTHLAEKYEAMGNDYFSVIFRVETMLSHGRDRAYQTCSATPFFWAYIMANGDVYSCSAFLHDSRFLLGNIYENNFKSIWEGALRKNNFNLLTTEFDTTECRKNCRMNAINTYLWNLKNQQNPHINFI